MQTSAVSRDHARAIAEHYCAEHGWPGVDQVLCVDEIQWRLPAIWNFSESKLRDHWIAYLRKPVLAAIGKGTVPT